MPERISTSEGAYDRYRVGIRGRPGALTLIAADSAFVPIHNGHAHLTAPMHEWSSWSTPDLSAGVAR